MPKAVALTNGMRSALTSIADITAQQAVSNKRLSTGKRVNDVLDNATNFFMARGFNQRAIDFNTLQDSISLGIKTIEVTVKALDGIEKLLQSALGLVRQARSITDATERTALVAQATANFGQVTNLANDASFSGRNLLRATPDNLVVQFNVEGTTSITLTGADTTNGPGGLNLSIAGTTDAQLDTAITAISGAISTVRGRAAGFSSSLAIVQIRQDYNRGLSTTLRSASDVLTLADMNEEGANLSALQTRQQLAVTALSLANQADQGILRLF